MARRALALLLDVNDRDAVPQRRNGEVRGQEGHGVTEHETDAGSRPTSRIVAFLGRICAVQLP